MVADKSGKYVPCFARAGFVLRPFQHPFNCARLGNAVAINSHARVRLPGFSGYNSPQAVYNQLCFQFK